MNKTLFVGNGINRLETNLDVSWEKVLIDLAQKLGGQDLLSLREYKPFTLVYETLQARLSQSGNKEGLSLKQLVSDSMQGMMPNQYHRKFLSCGFNNIITSNYDYCFEKTRHMGVKRFNLEKESYYSAFRRTKVGNTYIWHVHGEVEDPRSIMLGYEQYGGYLQKIRKYVLPSRQYRKINVANLKKLIDGEEANSWIDLFLRDEMHILGFSMDYSEIDIWWLIAFKAQCKARFGVQPGKTNYYHWTNRQENNRDNAKLQLLQSLGVRVCSSYEVKSFQACYDNFLDNFCVDQAS